MPPFLSCLQESVAIDAPSRESANLARNLIETHFKLQAKVRSVYVQLT